jgi:oxygen-independent coproporphyrinogen-3 oxidase
MIRHLYVHVPFCLRRCSYCDFAVQAVNVAPVSAWLYAVEREIELACAETPELRGSTLDTLYVGGGTPSLVGGAGIAGLRDVVSKTFSLDPAIEFTCEANPETLTAEVASEWRAAGVNRLSLGTQTFNEDALRWMGRVHGPEGPARALRAAREAGIGNISIDLIFGLPARFNRDWGADLDRVLELGTEHVSLYGLTAEKATPLGKWVAEGRETLADEEQYVAEYMLAVEKLGGAGFEHYEVSNFAKPGLASRHNQAYWRDKAYLGLGPGAHSYLPPKRRWNVRDWHEYQQRLQNGKAPWEGEEIVAGDAASLERSWLGLRTNDGLSLEFLSAAQQARLAGWSQEGLATVSDGTARLTAQGWLLLDKLVVELESTT